MEDEELYNIERIIDRRYINGKFEYKIKWEGYPMSQCTWEPLKNLEMAIELVEEYNNDHPIKNDTNKNSLNEITPKPKKKNLNNSFINKKTRKSLSKESTKNKKQKIEEDVKIVKNNLEQGRLMAVTEKRLKNGEITKEYISTEELRKLNPWVLLDFYESKIKFT